MKMFVEEYYICEGGKTVKKKQRDFHIFFGTFLKSFAFIM